MFVAPFLSVRSKNFSFLTRFVMSGDSSCKSNSYWICGALFCRLCWGKDDVDEVVLRNSSQAKVSGGCGV